MPTVNAQNWTTLYSATAQQITPQQPYGNANVEHFLNVGTDGGNTVQNILANGTIYANGNIEANGYFVGDGGYLSNIVATTAVTANFANYAGNVTNSAQPNITSVGTLVNLSVTGNIDSVSGIFNGDGYGLSNINVGNITGDPNFANFAGNVTNSAQPNITSVGTLVSLSATGNIDSVSGVFNGNGAGLTNVSANLANVSNANSSSSGTFYPVFVSGTGNVELDIDNVGSTLEYVPSSGTLVTNVVRVNYLTNDVTPSAGETIQFDGSNNVMNLSVTGAANAIVLSNTLANISVPTQATNVTIKGQIVFANNNASPDILVANNASNTLTRGMIIQSGNINSPTTASNQTAGGMRIQAGNSDGSTSVSTWIARGGSMIQAGGYATSNTGNAIGGAYNLFGGDATSLLSATTVQGGGFLLQSGSGTANVGNARSSNLEIFGGAGYTESGNSTGAWINITAGSATSNTSGNATAGSVTIDAGTASGVTSSTPGNINIGTNNATVIDIGNLSSTALSFYPYEQTVSGTSANVSLLKTGGNINGLYEFKEATIVNNWDTSIDNATFSEEWYAQDTVSGNTLYGGKVSGLMYTPVGNTNAPSYWGVQVFETTSNLDSTTTQTGTLMQVGQGGLTAIVGSQTSAPAIGTFIYGNTTQNQASAIRINRRRGNADSRANVAGSDYLGNIEWRGGGSATGSLNSKIVTFGAKVDSSYGGPGNVMPIGFELDVVNSSNAFIAHNFYANGDVSFSGGNSVIYSNGNAEFNDLASDNVSVNTNGFMKLASYTIAGLTAITGQIGWMAAVSDSASGGNPNGMIAFWDTTNARWSYVHDNSAV